MPSRVIRGEINSSASLSSMSMRADLTFRALLVAVDDYGRMDARPEMLKAALYPMRAEATPAKIEEWLEELAVEGCVLLYEVAGRRYLALTGWETHRGKQKRAAESRFPAPPVILGSPGDPALGSGSGNGNDERDIRGSPRISGEKKDARASTQSRRKNRSAPPRAQDPEAAHDQLFYMARAQLKAEEDRDYSAAEIEARMARIAS